MKECDANSTEEEHPRLYEINIYYGIHYPADDIDTVTKALVGTKYNLIATDNREQSIGKYKYMRNINSDFDENRGVIQVDEMSIQGEESNVPVTNCKLPPHELVALEERNVAAIEVITDIYGLIISQYKKEKKKLSRVYQGWYVYNCEWDDCQDQ